MPFFDQVQRASWFGIEFPVDKIEIHGSIRLAKHEYPHADGAALEPLGRNPYTIHMHMVFDENILDYPANYPDSLNTLRSIAENSGSGPLVIPNLGTINALCPSWAQMWSAAVLSGEGADYEWIEDMATGDTVDTFVSGLTSSRAMQSNYDTLAAMRDANLTPEVSLTAWQDLDAAFNAVMSIRDRADLGAMLVTARLESLVNKIGAIDRAITTPVGYQTLEALKRLWQATYELKQDVAQKLLPPSTFLVPRLMSATDVSRAIYGDTKHAIDILGINPIPDAYAIPAGTSLRYIPA